MTHLNLPQESIKVDVAFYNENEKQKFLNYPNAQSIEQLVSKEVDIPTAEFLTYYLFHRKHSGAPEYRDYDSIGRNIDQSLSDLKRCIGFSGHSIYTAHGIKEQLKTISWYIGEAIGLSVASRIHGLTSADWAPIKEGALTTFDYQIASDGQRIIQVENKGSSVQNNTIICKAIRTHKAGIVKKKNKLFKLVQQGVDPYPASLRYGTITAIDPREEGRAKCWLVDPDPEKLRESPRRLKLLNRMYFLSDWISLISPRAHLSIALATRLKDLEVLKDAFELNKVPLAPSKTEPRFSEFSYMNKQHSTFLTNKSHVSDGPARGLTIQISDKALFLLGIRENLLQLAINQDFNEIFSFKTKVGTVEKTVECVFSRRRFEKLSLPPSIKKVTREKGGYFRFLLKGQIHYNESGLVFGVLPLPSE